MSNQRMTEQQQTALPPNLLKRIATTAIKGENTRGSGGAVLFDAVDDIITYLLVDEFSPIEFASQLSEMITEDENEHVFIVNFENKEGYHVWKIAKSSLASLIS